MTPQNLEKLTLMLEKYPGGVLWSYVSTAYGFAKFLEKRKHTIKLKAVYTAAEPLFKEQRHFIEKIFGCPIFNNYSSIDTGDIAVGCTEHNGLHILTRNCYVEVLKDDEPVPNGKAGEFVITTLTNYASPLIRYKIEDWGKKSNRQCPCGRGLPLLEVVEGRSIDLFKTKSGGAVYGAFANNLIPLLGDVKQFQLIQKSLDLIVFKIVCKGPLDQQILQQLIEVSKTVMGDNIQIKFDYVDSLPSTPTGKHRYLVSEIDS